MSTKLRDSFAFSIGKEARKAEFVNRKQITIVPAPGHVFPDDMFTTKNNRPRSSTINMNERYRTMKINKEPGPTSYDVPSKLTENQKYFFGVKLFIDPLKNKTKTGPADYNINLKYLDLSKSAIISSINADSDTQLVSNIPGPGHYENMRDIMHYIKLRGSKIGSEIRKSQFL